MEQDYIAKTALDELVENDQDQLLKAMIPYLPSTSQQFLSVYAKSRELMNTMALFQGRKNRAEIQTASISQTDPLEMLQDIRKCCGGKSRRQIDQITELIATVQLFKLMSTDPQGGENP